MDLGAWTLRVSVAEPQGLFEAQIAGAEHLLGHIAAADVFADLAPVRKELSVWSARNEAVFVRTFGPAPGSSIVSELAPLCWSADSTRGRPR